MGFSLGAVREALSRLTRNAQDSFANLEDYNTMLLAYEAACRDIHQKFSQSNAGT